MSILRVVMAGIDHSIAGLAVRETFSFTKSVLADLYQSLLLCRELEGVVIISTCNRTEIYLSLKEGAEVEPFELLCSAAGIRFSDEEQIPRHMHRSGEAAIRHLCALASGMRSQIWGEDQIISQVKDSLSFAREQKATDSVLEVVFRTAISAAKKVKTEIKLNGRESSVAVKAIEIIKQQVEKGDKIKDVLVIGNGEIGRLMAQALVANGYVAYITLRQYKHSMNVVPNGVSVVEYNDRYKQIEKSDCVVSATLSPHHTIEFSELAGLNRLPSLLIDLAVPRDIDPEIHNIKGVSLYDIDSISSKEIEKSHDEQMEQANKIISKYINDYNNWCSYKLKLVVNQT